MIKNVFYICYHIFNNANYSRTEKKKQGFLQAVKKIWETFKVVVTLK